MNQSSPFTIKTVLLLLLALSLIYFQINASQRLVDMENQLSMMRNEINSVAGLVSQQNHMITEEKADYILYGIDYENETINSKVGVLSMTMNLSFTKLPEDAKVYIELESSLDHFPFVNGEQGVSVETANETMIYTAPQSIEFRTDGLNRFTSEMNYGINQNYKVTLVVKTPTDTFSEMLGIMPLLEWSQPAHYADIVVRELSSDSKNGTFKYDFTLKSLEAINSEFAFYDANKLYDFKNLENDINIAVIELEKASYKIKYMDKVIKEGSLNPSVESETGLNYWKIEDEVIFPQEGASDISSLIQIEFTTVDENGETHTITRGVFQ